MTVEITAVMIPSRASVIPSWQCHNHFDGAMKTLQVWTPLPFDRTLELEIVRY